MIKIFSRNPLHSVGMKLFIIFFICIVAFVAVVGFLSYQTSKNIIGEQGMEQTKQTFTQVRTNLDMIYGKYEELSTRFIIDENFQKLVIDYRDSTGFEKLLTLKKLESSLRAYAFSDPSITSISLFNLDGSLLYSMNGKFGLGTDMKDVEWFKEALILAGQINWVEPENVVASGGKENTFGISRLIKSIQFSHPIALILLEINTDVIIKPIADVKLGDTDDKLIVNEEGTVIYSTADRYDAGQSSGLISKEANGSFKSSDEYIASDLHGKDQLVVFNQSSEYSNWYVVGTVLMSELLVDTKRIFTISLIAAILAAILAIIIGYLLARSFGRPLINLRNLMHQGERGDLSVRTNIKSKDEIGQLGLSFNNMMEQINILVTQTNRSAQEVLNTAADLSAVSRRTALSSKEISIATEEIAGGASTLAMEAERGNELTHNIKSEMNNVIESNFEMGKSANEVRNVSEQGIVYMSELINKTNSTEQMTRSITEKVDKLKESTNSIREILDVLNKISKQTNILSLNATIEAARAGDAGKGFMVVADEIRKLADQSRQSIDIVGQFTEGIQSEVEDTVNVLSKAYPLFKAQTNSVREADLIFKNVQGQMDDFIQHLDTATNSIQQLENAQSTLSEAMSSVSAVSQESSATSQEVASLSAEQLNVSEGLVQLSERLDSLSQTLKESLNKFNT